MKLLIRSQSKMSLVDAENLIIFKPDENWLICKLNSSLDINYRIELGIYETKERALEVLDEIQKILQPMIKAMTPITKIKEDYKTPQIKTELVGYKTEYDIIGLPTYVYEMPEE